MFTFALNMKTMTNNNYHIFVENDKLGLKDPQNRIVLFAVYEAIDFTDVNTPVRVRRDGKWGLVDFRGNTIVEPAYSFMYSPCNGRIAVEKDNKWGFLDYKGKVVIPLIYDDAESFSCTEDCFGVPSTWVKKENKYGAINDKGEVIIPFEYDNADLLKGYAIVEKDKDYGVVNFNNELIVPLGDNDIEFLDNDIVSLGNASFCGAVNLTTREKYECDMGISEYGFTNGYAVVDHGSTMNIIDRQFKLQLPEWHDDIVLLDKGTVLICDKDSWLLYDKIDGKGVPCQHDDDYVYMSDGKTMYCRDQYSDTIIVEPGVENLAYVAADEDEDTAKYQMQLNLKNVKFKEGVTKIGTGWERICLDPCVRAPKIDIYLPSTLKKVHPNAFRGALPRIRNIYVPYGMGAMMKFHLPSYLHPFIKERSKGLARFLEGFNINGSEFVRNPFNACYDIVMPKSVTSIPGALLYIIYMFIIFLIPAIIAIQGFHCASDTILPFESLTSTLLISIVVISAILPFIIFTSSKPVPNESSNFSKKYFGCMFSWAIFLSFVCGFTLLLIFGTNQYIGGEMPQYTHGIIKDISVSNGKRGKSTHMDVYILKFDRIYNTWIPNDHNYHIGYGCSVEYHKGLFGLYVIDEVK